VFTRMMRFRLRTLLILLAVGPPLIAWLYSYPTVFGLIGGLLAFSCGVASVGGVYGKVVQDAGILMFACFLLP